ncbi:hypothetical protein ACLK1T_19760 [Escherichia coli]
MVNNKVGSLWGTGSCWQLPDVPYYEKVEKRLTDLSGALLIIILKSS